MLDAANRFLQSLSPEQRSRTTRFRQRDRLKWHYLLRMASEAYGQDRHGIMFKEMNFTQGSGASPAGGGPGQAGYIKAMKVMTMEDVVRVMENVPPDIVTRNDTISQCSVNLRRPAPGVGESKAIICR
jgi:hypothetical protein